MDAGACERSERVGGMAHTLLLITVGQALAVVAAAWRHRRVPGDGLGYRSIESLLWLGAGGLSFSALLLHACDSGLPWRQGLVTALGVLLIGLVVAPTRPRRWWLAVVLAAGLLSGGIYTAAVHSPAFTGNPSWAARSGQGRAARHWATVITGLWTMVPAGFGPSVGSRQR